MDNPGLAKVFIDSLLQENNSEFLIETSGSAGEPKTIIWHWKWMKWSAEKTIQTLSWNKDENILICLPVNKTGGWMMLVRALVLKCNYSVINPTADPMLYLVKDHSFTLISLTPHQFATIVANPASFDKLNRFRQILLGGGPVNEHILKYAATCKATVYHTYGMTETYSHIALKKLNYSADKYFNLLSDIQINGNEKDCLVINTPYVQGLETHDVARIENPNQFAILGRSDWVINTGGVKIHPELVEQAISSAIPESKSFYIGAEPDEVLGQRVVLFIEGPEIQMELTQIRQLATTVNPFAAPRHVVFGQMDRTETGKIRRKK